MDSVKENSNSIAFEIREETPQKNQRQSLTRLDNSFGKSPLKQEDIDDRLAQAEERRKSTIKQIQDSNIEHVKQIKEKSKLKSEQLDKEKSDLLEKLQEDLVIKEQRRNQMLIIRKESAKKSVEKIEEVKATRMAAEVSNSQEYAKRISEDMANKENNRQTIIQGVVQGCKQHAEHVEKTRRRVSLNKSMEMEKDE